MAEFEVTAHGTSPGEVETPGLQNYCIALQPICDGDLVHVADELLYRENAAATFANVADDEAMLATARVCHIAFYEIGIERLVGQRLVFVNTPRDLLLKPELLPPSSGQVVVEVLENVAADPEVLAALRQIRELGYEVALDDFVLTEDTRPLLDVATIIKVDLHQPFDADAVALYKKRGLRLLAEKVEDLQTFERLRGMGFTLFQGYFYARAETQQAFSSERSNNHAALVRLLVELQKGDVRVKEIERIIAQDAQLTFLLLRYTNSALFHYNGKIQTLFQALQVLGLKQAGSLALTMLLANHGPACKLLLSRALTRAGMCERLAQRSAGAEAAFFVGILSMMGELLGKSMEQLLQQLALSQEIMSALADREGELGRLLADIETFENARVHGWPAARVELFNQTWLQSQIWSTETLALIGNS
ncbi:MAG: HDOD domain-containing protein [Alcaligenaceae bacterium]|nr:HDOD domain-containing protein [Alcaligenaceae bacterium]